MLLRRFRTQVRVSSSLIAVGLFTGLLSTACSFETAESHVQKGDQHVTAGELREAALEYRNAVGIDPKLGSVRLKLAAVYEKLGDGVNALGEFVRAADLLPSDIESQLTASTRTPCAATS